MNSELQRWSPRGRPWPRGRPRGQILKSLALALASKVKSLALALASRPQVLENFEVLGLGLGLEGQVLGLGLEASSPRKLACPRLEDSTIFWNVKILWST